MSNRVAQMEKGFFYLKGHRPELLHLQKTVHICQIGAPNVKNS